MSRKSGRPSGGQIGNQNARKHGFYSKTCIPGNRDELPASATIAELDHDIAITRYKLKSLVDNDPSNIKLIGYMLALHDRLVRTRYMMLERRRKETKCSLEKLARALSITHKTGQARKSRT